MTSITLLATVLFSVLKGGTARKVILLMHRQELVNVRQVATIQQEELFPWQAVSLVLLDSPVQKELQPFLLSALNTTIVLLVV